MNWADDFLIFQLPAGQKRVLLKELGLQWPPPRTLRLRGFEPPHTDVDFRLLTMSSITDAERANMTHICRGAQYVYASKGVH